MSALQALKAARDTGVRIGVDGDALTLDADAAPPPAVLELLALHKAGVVALLRTGSDGWSGEDWRAFFDERAAIAEFDGGLPRDQAEARAFACCVAEWLNRNPMRSPAGRCLGCGGSDHAHDKLLPFGIELTGHAWLHSLLGRMARRPEGRSGRHSFNVWNLFEDITMSANKPTANAPKTVLADDPDDRKGRLKNIGGSQSDHWNNTLANQAVQALWLKNSSPEERDKQLSATVAALIGIAPKDELEGMMAAQLVAAHNAAMECYRRAMIGEQTFEGRRENLAQANKLSRTYAALLEALNRHRGKGQQKVTVEHVHVHAGGQAVVGMVAAARQPGGGDASKFEEQPHAKQTTGRIAHASEPTLPCPDAGRDAVPVARDGERALPDARRQGAGCGQG